MLKSACSNTEFTRANAGILVYYGAFVGCVNNRPESCLWAVATSTAPAPDSAATDAAEVDTQDMLVSHRQPMRTWAVLAKHTSKTTAPSPTGLVRDWLAPLWLPNIMNDSP